MKNLSKLSNRREISQYDKAHIKKCAQLTSWLMLKDSVLYAYCWEQGIDPMGFPGGSEGKESACNAGDLGSTPGLGRSPGRGHGNHFSIFA